MALYKISELPLSNSVAWVTFSYWDNTAGPLTKCLWVHASTGSPETSDVRLLTRLTLKTEVTRDPSLTDIDCNIYSLPEMSICAVSYLFGATCKAKPGKTIYCVTFSYKIDQRSKYMQWRRILDGVIKQSVRTYKVLLHKVGRMCALCYIFMSMHAF